jgi:GNAT superfamily N-acetyltransferase
MVDAYRIEEIAAAGCPAPLTEVAEATRLGFVGADLLPGLPTPDGARETPAEVERDLARGARIWLARDAARRAIGVVRALPSGRAEWELRRLAVVPSWRGRGIARALVRRLERDAARAGVARVHLSAVVERGNPIVYARLGYRTTAHWPSADKLLSEVTMERSPRERARTFRHPWEGDDGEAPPGPILVWIAARGALVAWLAGGGVRARKAPAEAASRVAGARGLVGVDVLCAGGRTDGERLRGSLFAAGGRPRDDGISFAADPRDVPAFCIPRELDSRLLAIWRLPRPLPVPASPRSTRAPAAASV